MKREQKTCQSILSIDMNLLRSHTRPLPCTYTSILSATLLEGLAQPRCRMVQPSYWQARRSSTLRIRASHS